MPAPLAKGLIITFSLLCAAGLAAYENPQVRQWIDESRRKVAIALHSLGDELAPDSGSRRNSKAPSSDASTREDEDPEAVERRRQARQEILERGRILEERRRSQQGATKKAKSFDDLVDKDGALKTEETTARSTAAEPQVVESGLRCRQPGSQAAANGSAFANPFADEMNIESPQTLDQDSPIRSRTPSMPSSSTSPPVPPKPAAYQAQRLLIDTDEISNHASEQLLNLTPTTSASSVNDDLTGLSDVPHISQSSFWSVNEWAQQSVLQDSPTPPDTEIARAGAEMDNDSIESHNGSGEHHSQLGSEDLDMMSDDEVRINTPGSWTEVGSQISDE